MKPVNFLQRSRRLALFFYSLSRKIRPSWFLVVATLLGALSVLLLKPRLLLSDVASGPEAISLFIPYTITGIYLMFLLVSGRLSDSRLLYLALVPFLIIGFSFVGHLREPIWYFYFDDPGRYSTYAHFMVSQGTLWGGDAIGPSANNVHFHDQPGYRYYLALIISLLGQEDRLLQLVNMFVYLTALLVFFSSITRRGDNFDYRWITAFLIFSLPYAANNILEGLSEWLAVALFLASVSAFLQHRLLLALVAIGLVAVVRQNLILASIFLALLFLFQESDRKRLTLAAASFTAILCIPLFHNLFYADQIRLFSGNVGNLIPWDAELVEVFYRIKEVIMRKLPQYAGYYRSASIERTLIAVLFVPFGTLLMLYYLFSLKAKKKIIFVLVAAFTIGPTLLFGWGYFPRFVFVNQSIVLASVPVIQSIFKKIK